MEPDFQWQYTGIVVIPSLTGGQSIELPFHIVSAAMGQGSGEIDIPQLTNDEIDSAALQLANQYLSIFDTSDRVRRAGFGTPTDIFLTSVLLVQI